uniref:Gnk2-homologous domain-containing protein n=1 Tax=Brassica oleracea var. oleracea TaxID=109376 RepID=A0A0D3BSJ4_BRAOL
MSISITNVSLIKGNITQECRGDSYGSKCRTCIDIAVAGMSKEQRGNYRV